MMARPLDSWLTLLSGCRARKGKGHESPPTSYPYTEQKAPTFGYSDEQRKAEHGLWIMDLGDLRTRGGRVQCGAWWRGGDEQEERLTLNTRSSQQTQKSCTFRPVGRILQRQDSGRRVKRLQPDTASVLPE